MQVYSQNIGLLLCALFRYLLNPRILGTNSLETDSTSVSCREWTRAAHHRPYCQLSSTDYRRQFITLSVHCVLCPGEIFKVQVWDKVAEGSALVLRGTRISVTLCFVKIIAENQLDLPSHSDRTAHS